MSTVIYDSSWPEINVPNATVAFECAADFTEWENGTLSADTFKARWGQAPTANWSIVIGKENN